MWIDFLLSRDGNRIFNVINNLNGNIKSIDMSIKSDALVIAKNWTNR